MTKKNKIKLIILALILALILPLGFVFAQNPPFVDIEANDSDGPITIPYNTSATLTWTSTNANTCYASGDWSGNIITSSSRSTGNLTSSKTYTITCSGPGGSASDSVTVNIGSATLSVSLEAIPSSGCLPLNGVDLRAFVSGTATGQITYKFDCTNNGTWEKIVSSNYTPYTAYNLCDYYSTGIYTAKVRVERGDSSAEDTTRIEVSKCYYSPYVNIKANGSDGPITIPYNGSFTLSWSSSKVNSCYASGDWSGSKMTSSTRTISYLTFSKTYTITCSGSGGSASDSVRVNITGVSHLTLNKLVRNRSDGTSWLNSVLADPNELISFSIKVTASNGSSLKNITVKDTLPNRIIYQGNLKIDGLSSAGNIISGLNIGNLSPGQTKTITFDANVADPSQFGFGQTQLINTVLAYTTNISDSASAKIIVTKTAVAGAATAVSTGLTNNLLLDSFILPLLIALVLIWLFKSRIINFEEWIDLKKESHQDYRSNKLLKSKIAKIIAGESFRRK